MLGLSRDDVRVVPYQPEWEALYREEAALLQSVLKDKVLRIEHIGSTAIVGMEAKPIIDLVVAVPNMDEAMTLVPGIEALGYEFRPDEPPPDRLFFARGPRDARTHHLSLTELTSVFFKNMILFRDFLRTHADIAEEYRALKKELAEKYPNQRPLYTEGKKAFVESVLEAAKTAT